MSASGGLREVRLPALSATMEEATLLRWLVVAGQEVTEGEPLAEVATDKVDMEIESPFAGIIHQLVAEEGSTVPLGAVLAVIETDADDLLAGLGVETSSATGLENAPEELTANTSGVATSGVPIPSPIVAAAPPARVLARRLGVDLSKVTPSGPRGQITPADVEAYARASHRRSEPIKPEGAVPVAPDVGVENHRRLAVRRATAEIMIQSATIPQFTLYRQLRLEGAASARAGRSWTTELVRAMAGALREHPKLNARWDPDRREPRHLDGLGIGIAIDRPELGLLVATVDSPDLMEADVADQEVKALIDRSRTGKLRPEDLRPASITLSNLGALNVDRFNALLFPPQALILSVGAVAYRPVATVDGTLKAELTCEVGLTIDHRVADGADGARYLDSFASLFEKRR